LKLLRFEADGAKRIGFLHRGRAIDLEAGRRALAEENPACPWDVPLQGGIHDIMRRGGWTLDNLRALADAVLESEPSGLVDFDVNDIRFLNPVPGHSRIFTCRGLNPNTLWTQHVFALPAYPTFDLATRTGLIGPHDPTVLGPYPPGYEYENQAPPSWCPELTVVIGKGGHEIPRDQALAHVAGYTIFIDGADLGTSLAAHRPGYSPEECLRFGTEPTYGRWCLNHAIGPWITTADELPDPYSVEFTLIDSGLVIDHGYATSLIFGVDEVVHFFSRLLTLEPGDLITMSSPGFDGLFFRPDYRDQPDPYIRVHSPQLGNTLNPIVDRRHAS
jgi:2-keto-4-pentenoate hydratase/2-oxohepta-3-ene-1,7-dioic acid hydratase in catechol pathway